MIDKTISMDKIPQWFEGARLNYAENLLRFEDDQKVAFYFTTERRDKIEARYGLIETKPEKSDFYWSCRIAFGWFRSVL